MAESSQVLGNELAVCGGMLSSLDEAALNEITEFNASDLDRASVALLEMAHRYITWSEVLRLSNREKKRWKESRADKKIINSSELQKCLDKMEK